MLVAFSWADASGTHQQGRGVSRDVSRKGEFILADVCPEEGAFVRLDLTLPHVLEMVQSLHIGVRGTVTRSEIDGDSTGFAVRNLRSALARINTE